MAQTPQEVASNINAYNADKKAHWNINQTEGVIYDGFVNGEHGASYFDGVDTDLSDFEAFSTADKETCQGLLNANGLHHDPC